MTYRTVIATLDDLPRLLFEARTRRGVAVWRAAQQMGVSYMTVYRIEAGTGCSVRSARAVLAWLDGTP